MTNPTPAVERATDSLRDAYQSGGSWPEIGQAALTAALTDPDDPDSLARTLFVLHVGASPMGWSATMALQIWDSPEPEGGGAREHWREVADGLRMMLTGSGS